MTFKVTVVNKFSENVLHKGRNGAGVKAELFFIRFDKMFGKHHVSDTKRGRDRFGKGMKKEYRCTLRTKKMIRAAFVELLGEKKNMETITVGELAERADIAKSTFYNHYDDVYAVAEEFENELIAKLSAVLDEIELERECFLLFCLTTTCEVISSVKLYIVSLANISWRMFSVFLE